jgi:hypothetical protein
MRQVLVPGLREGRREGGREGGKEFETTGGNE